MQSIIACRFAIVFAFSVLWLGDGCPVMAQQTEAQEALPLVLVPIQQASIDTSGDMPRLMINGQPTPPIVFFYNTRQHENYIERFQDPQVKLAAAAGVHIYSFLLPSPDYTKGLEQADYSDIETILDSFIRVDPQAVFMLRYWPGPNPSWPQWRDVTADDMMQFGDGSSGIISLASEFYWDLSDRGTALLLRHFEESHYAGRILAWHIGGPQFEMFPDQYREKGPDICPVNTVRFRTWLQSRYPTDNALQTAWGDANVTLTTAEVPHGETGRFPMHMELGNKPIQAFYDLPAEQNWVDYSAFTSDLTADRIIRWAELVRRETSGRRLSIFCYGYLSELVGSFNGHDALQRVLDSPAIDILMSPIPYYGRDKGEPAGFMSPVDSISAHGKLWLNEDDIRTNLIQKADIPAWLPDSMFGKQTSDMTETLNLLERNFAQLLMHRAATWWMDLAGAGAFNAPEPWKLLEKRLELYREVYQNPAPLRPEVAFLIDPEAKYYVKSDWDVFYSGLINLRNQCGRAGVSVGWYTLQDFISGVVPSCKAYLFANTFRLTNEQIDAIRARLDKEGSIALWVYAPAYLGPEGVNLARSSRLLGMEIASLEGEQGSLGEGLLSGLAWGYWGMGPHQRTVITPRLYVNESDDIKPLGRYLGDGLISSALIKDGNHQSVFLGDIGLSSEVLGRLFAQAGAHRWTTDGSVVLTDGRYLFIHGGEAGEKTITLPVGVTAESVEGNITRYENGTIIVPFEAGQSRWFRLQPATIETNVK